MGNFSKTDTETIAAVRRQLARNPKPKKATTRSFSTLAIIASGLLGLLPMTNARAEPYLDAEYMFRIDPAAALDDVDQRWIQQRGNQLHDPHAVTVFSMRLRAFSTPMGADASICEASLEIQIFEDSECRGRFCRMVIKCGSSGDTRRFNLTLMSRKNIAIAPWNFHQVIYDYCRRQAIKAPTPSGTVLVVVNQNGFELGDPEADAPVCEFGKRF